MLELIVGICGRMMRRKMLLASSLAVIIGAATLSIIQYRFGVPFTSLASGSLVVSAIAKYPVPTSDRLSSRTLRVDVFENGQKIGESGTVISLSPGKHTISFGDFNDTYESPQPREVEITHFEKTTTVVNYFARYGILRVNTEFYDAYNETHTSVEADIFIDGQWRGNRSVWIRYNEAELGNHTIFFSAPGLDLKGYDRPYNTTILVEKCKTTIATCQFTKILTLEEQEYVRARDKVRKILSKDLDPDSRLVTDAFLKWVLENKVNVPFYYININGRGNTPLVGSIRYIIAQYAGILLDERVRAFQNLHEWLQPAGIDLFGPPPEHSEYQSVREVSFQNQPETMFVVEIEYRLEIEELEDVQGGVIHGYILDDLANVISLFPNAIPAGIGMWFDATGEVYVLTSGLEKFEVVYPEFKEYSNLDDWSKGWYHATWKSISISSMVDFYLADAISQINQLISAYRVGVILLNPQEFLESVRILS